MNNLAPRATNKPRKRRKQYTRLTAEKKELVLEKLRSGDFITAISDAIGMSRNGLYNAKGSDPSFAKAWEEAETIGLQVQLNVTEEEMDFRGRIGWLEPKFYEGNVCGFIRKYSDALLLARAKALAPEKYGDKTKVDTTVREDRSIKLRFIKADGSESER